MDNKRKITLILITLITLIILFVGVFIATKLFEKEENKKNLETKKPTSSIKDDFTKNDASALSEKGNELLKLLQLKEIHSCTATTVDAIYYKKDYNQNTMPDGLKIYLGIMQYKETRNFSTSTNVILTKEEVRKGVEKVFGPDVKYKDMSYGKTACNGTFDAFTYDEATGNYTITPIKCDCDASKGEIISKPVKTEETDELVIVTEKILVAVPKYDSKTKKTTFKLFNTFDFTKSPLAELETYTFSDYEKDLVSYNFTFKKHKNGNYYFDSVKMVK